jgi:streptogramin lyase
MSIKNTSVNPKRFYYRQFKFPEMKIMICIKAVFINSILVFFGMISNAQDIKIVAGNYSAVETYSGDGNDATLAGLANPNGIARDASGNIYIADQSNNVIRMVNAGTGIITTVAGTGKAGYSGDGKVATLAELNTPEGIVFDKNGNLYIADTYNSVIRKINASDGTISTIAGITNHKSNNNGGYSGDGYKAVNAELYYPTCVVFDNFGNLYIADSWNCVIRKITITTDSIITTVAGNNSGGYTGDGLPATRAGIGNCSGLTFDRNNNMYIASYMPSVIRKVDAVTGIISTFAGNGLMGYSGDGGLAINALLNYPTGIAMDKNGNIYFTDRFNFVIRKIDPVTGIISTVAGNGVAGSGYGGNFSTSISLSFTSGIYIDTLNNDLYFSDGVIHKVSLQSSNTWIWTGASSSNWTDNGNWNTGTVPSATNNVLIPSPASNHEPTVNNDITVQDLIIGTGRTLTITDWNTLTLNGELSNSATITGNGFLNLGGIYFQTIRGTGTINNLSITNSSGSVVSEILVQIGNNQTITGMLAPPVSGTLLTSDHLTIASSQNTTASIASGSGAYIAGNVTVERYIPAHNIRGYTLISSPVNKPSIFNSWQENGNINAGFGTLITGPLFNNFSSGFDGNNAFGIPSIYTYNDSNAPGSKWVGLTNTQSNLLGIGTGYLLFVRGDRSVLPGSGTSSGATTLRAQGNIAMGTVTFATSNGSTGTPNLAAGKGQYTLIANPFASTIDVTGFDISFNNLVQAFYVYDPNLGTFVASNGYTVSPSNSQQQAQFIQSGQAFFVQNDESGNLPSITIGELAKSSDAVTNSANTVFGFTKPDAQININLYKQDSIFADGTVAVFSKGYSDISGNKDISKFINFNENISIAKQARRLSIATQPLNFLSDTLYINLEQIMPGEQYNLKIDGNGWNTNCLSSASLIDRTKNNSVALDMNSLNQYSFIPENNTDSSRFIIVLNHQLESSLQADSSKSNLSSLSVKLGSNPVESQVTVNYISQQPGTTTIRLINSFGQQLYLQSLGKQQQGSVIIPVDTLARGLYFVEVVVGNNKIITKVMKN